MCPGGGGGGGGGWGSARACVRVGVCMHAILEEFSITMCGCVCKCACEYVCVCDYNFLIKKGYESCNIHTE